MGKNAMPTEDAPLQLKVLMDAAYSEKLHKIKLAKVSSLSSSFLSRERSFLVLSRQQESKNNLTSEDSHLRDDRRREMRKSVSVHSKKGERTSTHCH